MRIRSIGSSPLKGGRHLPRRTVELSLDGPVGDREFAVVDLAAGRVLKTVENPGLLRCIAHWAGGALTLDIDGSRFDGVPTPSSERIELDYWGRPAALRVVEGPWAAPLSALLGREVVLARAALPGAVVYGDQVTLVTTTALRRLADATGRPVDEARFRANLVVDTGGTGAHGADAHPEDAWAGRELAVGSAVLRVGGGVPRCAVIDLDAAGAASATRLLRTLAGYRLRNGAIPFGVYATVVRAGTVALGDEVRLLHAERPPSRGTTAVAVVPGC
jgi:uncharacterized protein YcbX